MPNIATNMPAVRKTVCHFLESLVSTLALMMALSKLNVSSTTARIMVITSALTPTPNATPSSIASVAAKENPKIRSGALAANNRDIAI